jgi:hypothetical protein
MVPVLIGMVLVCGSAPADPARDRVAIAIAADSANVERVSQVLKELLGRLGVSSEIRAVAKVDPVAVVTPPSEPEQALARVFIDASGDDAAIVYIVDTRWERILVRRVPLSAGVDEVVREEIGHIVESSVEALRAGGQIGVSREEASEALGVPPTPEKPAQREPVARPVERRRAPLAPKNEKKPPGLILDLGVGWEAALWTRDQLRHGPLVRIGFGSALLGGSLVAQYRIPLSKDAEPIGLRQESGALRALAFFRPALASDLHARIEVGAGLDVERVEPRITEDGATSVSDAKTRAAFVGRVGAGLDVLAFGESWLSGIFALEIDPSPDDYAIRRGSRTETVAKPLYVRPGFSLILTTPLAGN